MKKIGILSTNIYGNFTNYGSALQSYGLYTAINKYKTCDIQPVLINYLPDIQKDVDPLNPIKKMWDTDPISIKMCELSLPAIKINHQKFMDFFKSNFRLSKKYTKANFEEISQEGINSFVCGSDTIFCTNEFGFDDGYYSNYPIMKTSYSFSYAASFGDAKFNNENDYNKLMSLLNNFNALGLREDIYIDEIKKYYSSIIQRVIDPTLLLEKDDYNPIIKPYNSSQKYILLYARRYNEKMEKFADDLAKKHNAKVIEISLRATNCSKHTMFYAAGVEEFLGLIQNAEFIVTNSFHGIIFSLIFNKEFFGFAREQSNNKIKELLDKFAVSHRLLVNGTEDIHNIDYNVVNAKIAEFRNTSITFLQNQLLEAFNNE